MTAVTAPRQRGFFGTPRKPRTFREAATRFLEENQHKRSLERDARALALLDPSIGGLTVQQVHYGTLRAFIRDRLEAGRSPGTVNSDLAVVRRILNLCARLWRDESDRPWLDTAVPSLDEGAAAVVLELAPHLARMALFKVNTGTREHEVGSLRWSWEVRVPELDTSVFVVPGGHVKNGIDRYVVLNRIA